MKTILDGCKDMGYVKWLGHSAFEIVLDNKKILVDPWLTNPLSPVKPEDYKDVDFIVVTHDHGDHLGDALTILKRTNAKFIGIYELAQYMIENGISEERSIGGNIGGPIKIDGIEFILTQATHSSNRGAPTGVVIKGKEATIYHAGDTGLFYDMALIGELYKPDIALLPIGGHFTMGPYEAAKAVELIKPKVVIPMHYKTFPVIGGSPEEFLNYVKEKKLDVKVVVLKPGEKYEF